MAGLSLTVLAISPDILHSKLLIFLVSTASFLFILSSFYMFVYSVDIGWSKKVVYDESSKESLSWKIVKYSFFFGIVFLLLSTLVIVYNLWFTDFLQLLKSDFKELSNITNLKNSTNLTVVNQT
jgi:hypothetical protein